MKTILTALAISSFLLNPAMAAPPVAGTAPVAGQAGPRLDAVSGLVRVKMTPTAQPVPGVAGMSLVEGAEVSTLDNSRAMIRFNATDIVRLGPKSRLLIANLPSAGKQATLLKLVSGSIKAMLRRTGVKERSDFAMVASGAVCAIKGTVVDIVSNADGTASFTVDNGTAQVFRIDNPNDLVAAFNSVLNNLADQANVTVVKDGFQVTASAAALSKAVMAPVNPNLEVVSGSVRVTIDGVTTVKTAGETIPPGAKIESDGDAVLQGSQITVDVKAGSSINYTAVVDGYSLSAGVTANAGSSQVGVSTASTALKVDGGEGIQISKTPLEQMTVKATAGEIEMTGPAGESSTIKAPPESKTGEPGTPGEPPSEANINEAPIDLPPPPPETPKQDEQEYSPVAPKN